MAVWVRLLSIGFLLFVLAASQADSSAKNSSTVAEQWMQLVKEGKTLMKRITKQTYSQMLRILQEADISTNCTISLLRVYQGVQRLDKNSIIMLDANGRLAEGATKGTLTSLGSYEQCLELVDEDKGRVLHRGQYCQIHIIPPIPPQPKSLNKYPMFVPMPELEPLMKNNKSILSEFAPLLQVFYARTARIGICTPSTCSQQDLQKVATRAIQGLPLKVNITLCEVDDPKVPTTTQTVIMSIMTIPVLVVSVATLYTMFRDDGFARKLGRLSALGTTKWLISGPGPEKRLVFIHGLRVMSLIWVVWAHSYLLALTMFAVRGPQNFKLMNENFIMTFLMNGTLSVDSFFFMSGFFLSYLSCKDLKRYSVWKSLIKRFIRILPPYVVIIGLAFIFPLLGSGPNWYLSSDVFSARCHELWWRKLLFIESFFSTDFKEDCALHGWFLATDFQLFLTGTLVLVVLSRNRKLGVALASLLVVSSCVWVGIVTHLNDYYPSIYVFHMDIEYLWKVYFSPFCHAGPYFVGFLIGYYCSQNIDSHLSRKMQALCWILSPVLLFCSLFGLHLWNRGLVDRYSVLTSVYAAVHRAGWGAGLALGVLLLFSGCGARLARVFGCQGFIVLSRLSFSGYLLHVPVLLYFTGSYKVEWHYDYISVTWFFFGSALITAVVSYFFDIFYLGPFSFLEQHLMGRRIQRRSSGNGDLVLKIKF